MNKRDSLNNLNYIQNNVILDPNFLKQKINSTMNSQNAPKLEEISNTRNNTNFNYYDSEKFRNTNNQNNNNFKEKNFDKQRHSNSQIIEMKVDEQK